MPDPDLRPRTNFLDANWREIVFTVLAIAAFYAARFVVQWLDPSAATTDFGALDVIAYAITASLAAHLGVWIVLRVAMKTFHRYLDDKALRRDFIELPINLRVWTALAVVAFELWLIVRFAALVAGAQ
jgi:signal transduction histidine kinase